MLFNTSFSTAPTVIWFVLISRQKIDGLSNCLDWPWNWFYLSQINFFRKREEYKRTTNLEHLVIDSALIEVQFSMKFDIGCVHLLIVLSKGS